MSNSKNQNSYEDVKDHVSELLEKYGEWEERYAEYAAEIDDKKTAIRDMRRRFHQKEPLYVYSKISAVTKAATKRKHKIEYDLRFLGQSVATIRVEDKGVEDEGVYLSETEEQHKSVETHFSEKLPQWWKANKGSHERIETEHGINWREAKEFRKFFKEFFEELCKKLRLGERHGKSREHFYENKLLVEFNKKCGEEKSMTGIQPVKLAGAYFQMPTPLSASRVGMPSYSKENGGGIDILARVRRRGETDSWNLCLMELKDENKSAEPPEKAMEQAVAYAVFIAHLLRSKSGEKWYKIFRERETNVPVPEKLTLIAAVVMPKKNGATPCFGENIELAGGLNTTIMLRSLYFEENETVKKKEKQFKFSGSLYEYLGGVE